MLPVNYTGNYVIIPKENIYTVEGSITSMVLALFFGSIYSFYCLAMVFIMYKFSQDQLSKKPKLIIGATLVIIVTQLIAQAFRVLADILFIALRVKMDNNEPILVDFYNAALAIEFISNIIDWSVPILMVNLLTYVQLLFWETNLKLHVISELAYKVALVLYISLDIIISTIWGLYVIWGSIDSIYMRFNPLVDYVSFFYSIIVSISIFGFLIALSVMGLVPGIILIRGIMNNKVTTNKNPFIVTLLLLMGMLFSIFIYNIGIPVALTFSAISRANGMANDIASPITVILLNIFDNVAVISFSIFAMCLFYPILKNKDIFAKKTTSV